MNGVLILDLTANCLGWEHESTKRLQTRLNGRFALQHSLTIKVEDFELITKAIGFLDDLKEFLQKDTQLIANINYFLTKEFMDKCLEINNQLNNFDYINIRCHGHKDEANPISYADIFCAKHKRIETIKEWATFAVLLQNIPNLKSKSIFFTVCYGAEVINDFYFDGLNVSDEEYIVSFDQLSSSVSDDLICTHISKILDGYSWREAFNMALGLLKENYKKQYNEQLQKFNLRVEDDYKFSPSEDEVKSVIDTKLSFIFNHKPSSQFELESLDDSL